VTVYHVSLEVQRTLYCWQYWQRKPEGASSGAEGGVVAGKEEVIAVSPFFSAVSSCWATSAIGGDAEITDVGAHGDAISTVSEWV